MLAFDDIISSPFSVVPTLIAYVKPEDLVKSSVEAFHENSTATYPDSTSSETSFEVKPSGTDGGLLTT